MKIANTPQPPYYAVIFTSILRADSIGYNEMAIRMEELVSQQEGFLGFESAREAIGITVSYWKDETAIKNWKSNLEHKAAQEKGIQEWYESYFIRICKVERAYAFKAKKQ